MTLFQEVVRRLFLGSANPETWVNEKIQERKAREATAIEAQDVHKRYLKKRLEELKKKTIAEAERKN